MRAEGCYHHPLLPLNTTVSSLINHSLKEALYCTDIFTGTDGAFTDLFRVSANTCMCTFICACSELDKHQSRQMHTNSNISYCIICDSLLSLCLLSVNVNGVVMSVWFTDINVRRDLLIPANLSVKLKHSSWAEPRLRCLIRTIVKISVFLYFEKCEVLIMHSNDSSWLILKKKKKQVAKPETWIQTPTQSLLEAILVLKGILSLSSFIWSKALPISWENSWHAVIVA